MFGAWERMAVSPIDFAGLDGEIEKLGMCRLGIFQFEAEHLRVGSEDLSGAFGVLIGNAGPAMWNVFSVSAEYADGAPDPMNRWTRRVLENLGEGLSDHCLFPFDEPYWPFQRFLHSALGLRPSPLGLYIHPEFGLWHALRGVLVFSPVHGSASLFKEKLRDADKVIQHPCDTCRDKPCLATCPVDAFTGEGLDISSCFKHLKSGKDPSCLTLGCHARHACPIGKEYHYCDNQMRFHMTAYYKP